MYFKRLKVLFKKCAPALIAGAVLLLLAVLGIGIPCTFYRITGLQCPGCGATRMVLALLRFDFAGAFAYNQGLFIAIPILALTMSASVWRYLRHGIWKITSFQSVVFYVILGFMLIFAVFRNL